MDQNIQNFQPTDFSFFNQNQIPNTQIKNLQAAFCENQFYQLQKKEFSIKVQRFVFKRIKCFLQLSPDRFVIGALKEQIKEDPINFHIPWGLQQPNGDNQPVRAHRQPQNNINNQVNIQPNYGGDIQQFLNINYHVPFGRPGRAQILNAPRQINLGNARNRHRRVFARRIGYISSEQQDQTNIFNGTILYLFYVDAKGNILNKIRYGVRNNYKIYHFSNSQILLQIDQREPPFTPANTNNKIAITKISLETKKNTLIFRSREYKPKTSLYFSQTKLICVIEKYAQSIIENISVRYFSCIVQGTSAQPDYSYTFEINDHEEDFHFTRGNNSGLTVWYIKVLDLQNEYIQFYYKSNETNPQEKPKRIIIQKPSLIKKQDCYLQSVLEAGQNASKFILFIKSKENIYAFVYEVDKRILRQIELPLCQIGKRLRIDPIVPFVTRIIVDSSVYYVDNVSERIFCHDYLSDSITNEEDNDQEQFTQYSSDFLNQVRYSGSTFQIRNSGIVKACLFALVFLLEQYIIDAHKDKVKKAKLMEDLQNEGKETFAEEVISANYRYFVDMDLVLQVMVLLGLTYK